ncbi:alpha/beta hydrolase [Nostoc commune]|uniref:alpha/beta hydrolase n=1 Tax=Nostoc commune TaxID=1178 RepID=UPI003969E78C
MKVSPVVVSQLLYTPQGEFLLASVGASDSNQSARTRILVLCVRALISASAESGGLVHF